MLYPVLVPVAISVGSLAIRYLSRLLSSALQFWDILSAREFRTCAIESVSYLKIDSVLNLMFDSVWNYCVWIVHTRLPMYLYLGTCTAVY